MYKPFLEEYATKNLLRFSSLAASSLVSFLPPTVRSELGFRLGEKFKVSESGKVIRKVAIGSRKKVVKCMRKIVRRHVMFSSARQAVSGLLTVGVVHGARYLASKMRKAWKSWI